jgi:hypothetical protein
MKHTACRPPPMPPIAAVIPTLFDFLLVLTLMRMPTPAVMRSALCILPTSTAALGCALPFASYILLLLLWDAPRAMHYATTVYFHL